MICATHNDHFTIFFPNQFIQIFHDTVFSITNIALHENLLHLSLTLSEMSDMSEMTEMIVYEKHECSCHKVHEIFWQNEGRFWVNLFENIRHYFSDQGNKTQNRLLERKTPTCGKLLNFVEPELRSQKHQPEDVSCDDSPTCRCYTKAHPSSQRVVDSNVPGKQRYIFMISF